METVNNLSENGGSELIVFTSPEEASEEVATGCTTPSRLRSYADNNGSSSLASVSPRKLPSWTVLE